MDDLFFMVIVALGGVLTGDGMRRLAPLVFMAGNVNCLIMATVAVERVLALTRPLLFKRLGRISKVQYATKKMRIFVLCSFSSY